MAERGHRARPRTVGFALAALSVLALVATSPAVAFAASQSGSVSVDIVDDATPSPSPTQSGGSQNPGASGSGGTGTTPGRTPPGGSGGSNGAVPPANLGNDLVPASEVPPGEEVLFFVSGLAATGHPSANPVVGGRVTAELNVQNLTSERIDATVDFHADDLFGNEVAKAPTSTLIGLQPDEMRAVSVDLGEVRIAGLVRVYATVTPLTPPGMTELEPINRDAWTALPSWYAVGLLTATAITLGVGAFFRFRRGL